MLVTISKLTHTRRVENTEEWDKFKLIEFEPKPLGDYDIDIKIAFCGVCGSDVSLI